MARKFSNPGQRLLSMRKPKSEEHKRKIQQSIQRYWQEARAEYAKLLEQEKAKQLEV